MGLLKVVLKQADSVLSARKHISHLAATSMTKIHNSHIRILVNSICDECCLHKTHFPCQNVFLQVCPGAAITLDAIHTPERLKHKSLAARRIHNNNNLHHSPRQSPNLLPRDRAHSCSRDLDHRAGSFSIL